MTDPRETYTAAALEFASVALGPNGVCRAVTTDEYRTAFAKLQAVAPSRVLSVEGFPVAHPSDFPRAPAVKVPPVSDGPGLTDREVEMHLSHFASADFAGGLVARELWERLKMLVKVDYSPDGSGKMTARVGATPDGATRVTRVFER